MKRAAKARSARVAPMVRVALICLATYLGLFAMLLSGVTPEQYDIQVGVPAPTDIKATKDVQDTVTTDQLREEAARAIEPSYKSADNTVLDAVLNDLSHCFAGLRSLRSELSATDAQELSASELAKINEELSLTLSREQISTLIETSDETLDAIFAATSLAVRDVINATLPEGQESNAIKSIRSDLYKNYSTQLTSLAIEAVEANLRPNMLIDEDITEAKRQEAREAVQAKWYVKDQVIVNEGEIVTKAQYTTISALGILDEDTFDVRLICGLALLIAILLVALGFYLRQFNPAILESPKQIMLLCLILLLVVGLSLCLRIVHSYLMPVSLGLLLVALLIDSRLALFVNLILSLLLSTLISAGSGAFTVVLMTTVCGPFIVNLFAHKMLRTTSLVAGVIIGVVNFFVTLAVGLINSAQIYDVLVNAGVAAGSGIVSAILCIGLQPLLEALFNLATASKLIELSNPNQPLLRRLLLEASGTYHHSIIVANLAEAGCSAVGANGLLARVGAYYHDIGKLKRPMYFKENQMGDNPHDRTDPRVSTAILTAHTRDGVQLAQKARIPEPVVDIIRQHHGDAPVMFFYDKAQKLYGDQVDISAFRYEGPRPQSREAAIVMLADGIEAAARAIPNPDPEKIDALIHKMVRGRLNDGQLDNSNLTFNDLDKICSAFSTVLTGVFHERIEYPDITIPPRVEKLEIVAEEKPESIKAGESEAAPQPKHAAKAEEPVKSTPAVKSEEPAKPAASVKSAEAAKPAEPAARPIVTLGQAAPPVQTAPAKPAAQPSAPAPEETAQKGEVTDAD